MGPACERLVELCQVVPDAFAKSSKLPLILAVSGMPCGRRPTTRIPCGASSADSPRVSASSAAIAGPPPPTKGTPVRDGVEVTVMITPDPAATIRRAARRAVRKYDVV